MGIIMIEPPDPNKPNNNPAKTNKKYPNNSIMKKLIIAR